MKQKYLVMAAGVIGLGLIFGPKYIAPKLSAPSSSIITSTAVGTISTTSVTTSVPADTIKLKIVRSPSCGCCGNYIEYLKKNGFDVQTEFESDDEARRARFGVPDDLASCHTMSVEGYVVEGHVPVEAIRKLLSERPKIKGIALPGMPVGSPGMPGRKQQDFIIESFDGDGSSSEFMRI